MVMQTINSVNIENLPAANNLLEEIEDDEPRSSAKKPSGALQLKESDQVCEGCECRKANASCNLALCLQCCVRSNQTCTYRGHVTARRLASLPNPRSTKLRPTKPRLTNTPIASKSNTNREHQLVYAFLENLHLEQYAPILITNGFDTLASIGSLDEDLLDRLGIKLLGHRALLLSVASQIQL
jgi:hypothetical protein